MGRGTDEQIEKHGRWKWERDMHKEREREDEKKERGRMSEKKATW